MGVNINTVRQYVNATVLKDLGLGYLDNSQFNAFASMCNVQLFNRYAEIFQNTQRVTDKLRPFIKKSVLPIDETGKMDYPTDYVNKIAVRGFDQASYDAEMLRAKDLGVAPDYNVIKQIKIKTIDNDKLADRMNAGYLEPTRDNPINTFYDTYNQVYPTNIGVCIFEYLRQPVTPIWASTTATNGLPVYDPANSINFEFDWIMQNEIIITICNYFGVSVSEQQLVENANGLQKQQA